VRFELIVDNDTNFLSPIIDQPGLIDSTFTPSSGSDDGVYYWKVRAQNSEGVWGDWSNTWNVTIDFVDPIPAAPSLISPADNATVYDDNLAFSWTAPDYAAVYELLVDDSSEFDSPVTSINSLDSTRYIPEPVLSEDEYYWKVRARNAEGEWGDWSETWSFAVLETPTAPKPGKWSALVEFGRIEFTINSTGTAITLVRYEFDNFWCGGSYFTGSSTTSGLWAIDGRSFTFSTIVSGGSNRTMSINGSFTTIYDIAYGRYTLDVNGTKCSGNWIAFAPE
jgi:hypothetical protein